MPGPPPPAARQHPSRLGAARHRRLAAVPGKPVVQRDAVPAPPGLRRVVELRLALRDPAPRRQRRQPQRPTHRQRVHRRVLALAAATRDHAHIGRSEDPAHRRPEHQLAARHRIRRIRIRRPWLAFLHHRRRPRRRRMLRPPRAHVSQLRTRCTPVPGRRLAKRLVIGPPTRIPLGKRICSRRPRRRRCRRSGSRLSPGRARADADSHQSDHDPAHPGDVITRWYRETPTRGGGYAWATKTSRLLVWSGGLTTPCFSISSTNRAARLYPIRSWRWTHEIDALRVVVTM